MPEIIIPSWDGGSFSAYIAMPEKTHAPVVIMIQEIFGVNAEMRAKCDAMAAHGFIAVCPDLFWRLEPGVQLTDQTDVEWSKAFDLMNRFDIDQGVEDLRATAHTFKGHADSTGKVGCVGYCLGGKLAYLMATRTHIDCAVSYYGVGLDALLGEADKIRKPIMLHIAEEDKFVPPEAQAAIKNGLQTHPMVTINSYPGVNHAFARGEGEHYDQAAAQLADDRTLTFLRDTLDLAQAA